MVQEIETYIKYLVSFDPNLSHPHIDDFLSQLTISKHKKNSIYLKNSVVPTEIGFIINGLIRSYIVDEKGNEKTINFFPEMTYVGDYHAFINKIKSQYFFQCIETTTIINIPYKVLTDGYRKNPSLEKHGRILAEKKLVSQNIRLKSFMTLTAEERYLDFIEQNPKLLSRISISQLSSYLGVERQSLTRIRKRLSIG